MAGNALNGRHLQIFVTLMKSRGLAEAALKLGISEPAISKTIRLMEAETGTRLFVREGGRLKPSADARQLLPHAQRAVRQTESALTLAYALAAGRPKPLVIAAHAPPLVAIVAPAVRRFHELRPGVPLELRVESPLDVLRLVSHQEVELGVTNPPSPRMQGTVPEFCESRTLSEDLLVALLPAGHPLALRSVIRPEDLRGQTIVALPDDSPTAILTDAVFREAGVPLHAPLVASNAVGVVALVQQGVGVGLINPLLLHTGMFPAIVMRPFLPRIVLWTELYHSSLRPPTGDAALMVQLIEDAAAELRRVRAG